MLSMSGGIFSITEIKTLSGHAGIKLVACDVLEMVSPYDHVEMGGYRGD